MLSGHNQKHLKERKQKVLLKKISTIMLKCDFESKEEIRKIIVTEKEKINMLQILTDTWKGP